MWAAQPPLAQGDGPIALVIAPTRELVNQIGKDVHRFGRALGLSCVCAYGGSALAGQITNLKRGAEVCALPISSTLPAVCSHAGLSAVMMGCLQGACRLWLIRILDDTQMKAHFAFVTLSHACCGSLQAVVSETETSITLA